MAQPYVGEIRLFAGNFAPAGWAHCHGQLLPISENETLFQLIGTTYGGDGQSTFALPDLRGRTPLHQGNGFILAETGGVETVTLTPNQMPAHNHAFLASNQPGVYRRPDNAVLSASSRVRLYNQENPYSNMLSTSIQLIGGSQPHENMQPFLCINYIISLFGIFPSPT
jgi:microcystin-dependent protein